MLPTTENSEEVKESDKPDSQEGTDHDGDEALILETPLLSKSSSGEEQRKGLFLKRKYLAK